MKLSIIIVNYNVQFFLENCLNSVFNAIKYIDAEVLVVDNNSVDGSVEMVKLKFPQVKLIANKENSGFSKANNQAIGIAKGELVLLLNPDTVVEEDTFKICCDFFDKNLEAGGLGIKMLDGRGQFLPESKRGLPTPSVAFYKIFGLSSIFPKSATFSKYHLGHLSKDKNHQIEILSGAYMMIRKKVLDQIGLLDENFFMYGEDIDLSYRITQAGFKNYYLADTSIIHYKGESTKKSSINYVFVFYRAMAIFAKKHFSNKNAQLFSSLINLAIYLRAAAAVLTRTARHVILPIIDTSLLFIGISFFKSYYESKFKYIQGGSYPEEVAEFGIPIMLLIYLVSAWLNGSYSIPTKFTNILKGVFSGSLIILITYSLLDESYRFSRAIILFSVLWALFIIPAARFILNLSGFRKFKKTKETRIAIIGKRDELHRITKFLKDTLIQPELISYINSDKNDDGYNYSGKIEHLKDIIEIYKITEVIFCSKDISSSQIIKLMSALNKKNIDFKIAPPESIYIIGSNSIDSAGDYYITGSNAILKPINQKNKRILDFTLALLFLFLSPILILINGMNFNLIRNLLQVLFGSISFVGFINSKEFKRLNLKIKKGILNSSHLIENELIDKESIERLNFEYGRDYNILKDLEIIFKNLGKLSNSSN
jgi:GT2 family glycosyltransferase